MMKILLFSLWKSLGKKKMIEYWSIMGILFEFRADDRLVPTMIDEEAENG